MLFFSGSANLPLAEKVAKELNIKIASSETVRFADGEARVRVSQEVKDQTCVVLQSLSTPADRNLMELCQFGDTLKRGLARRIIAVIPYLAYARQHKAHRVGEAVSAKIVADFIKVTHFTDAVFLDLHEEEVLNYYKIPTQHLSCVETFAHYIDSHRDDFGGSDLIIVAPDKGRSSEAQFLAEYLETDYSVITKNRSLTETDKVNGSFLTKSVKEKEVIIYDDMVSTGSTAVKAAQECQRLGAFKVFLMATHAVLSRGDKNFWQDSPFEKVIVSDSINIPESKMFDKLQIISLGPLLAKNLSNFL